MPRGASGFSGSVNSSPTYSRRFDDPLFDLTREAILRAFRSMVTLRLFAHVEFTSRNMFDVCHWFPKRSDDSRTRASVTALMEALAAIESQIARLDEQLRELARRSPVCTENLIRIDCVTESPNVNGDDRALLPLPDPVRLAVQVEEPT